MEGKIGNSEYLFKVKVLPEFVLAEFPKNVWSLDAV
jgi:hypothetical protein